MFFIKFELPSGWFPAVIQIFRQASPPLEHGSPQPWELLSLAVTKPSRSVDQFILKHTWQNNQTCSMGIYEFWPLASKTTFYHPPLPRPTLPKNSLYTLCVELKQTPTLITKVLLFKAMEHFNMTSRQHACWCSQTIHTYA